MLAEVARDPRLSAVELDPTIARLRAAVDLEALIEVGYDPDRRVFAPSPDHPVFGFKECVVRNCSAVAVQAHGLCGPCTSRRRRGSNEMTLEEFVAVPRVRVDVGRKPEVLCRVCRAPGFERPAYGPATALPAVRTFIQALDGGVGRGMDSWGPASQRPAHATPAGAAAAHGRGV